MEGRRAVTLRECCAWTAFVGLLCFMAWEPKDEPTPSPDPVRIALAESLATARAEAKANLRAWQTALDSAPRDTVVRRVVRYIARHDTAWATGKDPPG